MVRRIAPPTTSKRNTESTGCCPGLYHIRTNPNTVIIVPRMSTSKVTLIDFPPWDCKGFFSNKKNHTKLPPFLTLESAATWCGFIIFCVIISFHFVEYYSSRNKMTRSSRYTRTIFIIIEEENFLRQSALITTPQAQDSNRKLFLPWLSATCKQ